MPVLELLTRIGFELLSHAVKQVKTINERKRQIDFFEYKKDNDAIESSLKTVYEIILLMI
jgi:hypothetical protein